jgi:diketogulonate reductase-like aldo/keto reductase
MIGGALKTIFSEGKYKREDIFITTKVFPFRNFNCIAKLEESLKDL